MIAPKRLLTYYGYPIDYKGIWDTNLVIDAISLNFLNMQAQPR